MASSVVTSTNGKIEDRMNLKEEVDFVTFLHESGRVPLDVLKIRIERARSATREEIHSEGTKEEIDFWTFLEESGKVPLDQLLKNLDEEESKAAKMASPQTTPEVASRKGRTTNNNNQVSSTNLRRETKTFRLLTRVWRQSSPAYVGRELSPMIIDPIEEPDKA